MKFNTKTIHGNQEHDKAYGSVMPPIYQTSTYAQSTPGGHKGYEYSRSANPTRTALENSFASIENGTHGLAFGSGLAAIDAVMKLLKPGDEVISTNDLYGGTYRLFTKIFEGFGIKFHFVGMENASNIDSFVNKNTKLIWVSLQSYVDTGGAHGNGRLSYLNFNPQTGALLKQNDIISNLSQFKKIAKTAFEEQTKPKDDDETIEDFLFGEDFQLPANIGFTKEGLTLLYNNYEIASYAQGITKIVLPYDQLNGLLKVQ